MQHGYMGCPSAAIWDRHLQPVTSHNTPVTMLTNFWLVPGHAVTSFAFWDSRNLGFVLELGCKAPNTIHPDIIITPSHFRFFRIMEDSYPRPYLLWKMDICVPEVVAVDHHCTYEGCYPEDQKSKSRLLFLSDSAFLCSLFMWHRIPVSLARTSNTPDLMLCYYFSI